MVTQPLSSRRGSNRFPSGCLVPFFGLFFLVGAAAFYFATVRPVMRYFASRSWTETTCTVLSSQVGEHSDSDGSTYSVDVVYTYSVEGRAYQSDRYGFLGGSSSGRSGKEAVVARYPPGARVSCWFDPAHPEMAVLSREPSAAWLVGLIPLLFLIVGAAGVVWTVRTVRRQRIAASALPLEFSAAPASAESGSLELKPEFTPRGKFFGLLFVALFWNGIVSVFVWHVISAWRAGTRPDGCMTVFLIPFVLVGLGLIYAVIRQFLVLFNPRLHLTLTPGTLAAGETGYLQWSFGSRGGGVKRLTIVLEGREEAQYRRGTTTYTDKSVFATLTLVDTQQEIEIPAGSASFSVPPDTVSSFTAPHNKIRWALKAHSDIPGWPDSEDEYEIQVGPGRAI
jgi:Protein of unknown function (DUF3592)